VAARFNLTDECFKFCQSLPDYSLQIGMETEVLSLLNGVNSVLVDGSWKHSSGNIGAYFSFNVSGWKAYFGEDVTREMTKEVKLCRNGTEAWRGVIKVWPPSSKTKVYAGRSNAT
jgi:trehalose utilization protein